MFWRYNALTSHIDTLLEKETVTLRELMDEDDILQECKGQNHKLIEFLVNPEVMEELVKLITCEPNDDEEDKVRYKYPNIACELLTSDASQILDKLVEDNVLIDKIYSFILSNEQLNPLLASFFTKVLGLLLVRKADYLFDYLTSKEDFLGRLLSHIGTSAIMDLLMRLVTYEPMYETKAKILQWMDQEQLIHKLVKLIHPDKPEEDHYNAASVLCDIVRFGREQLGTEVPQSDPLLDIVESEGLISELLTNMLDNGSPNESVVTNGLQVVQTILEYRRQISSFDDWRPLPEGCIEPLPQPELDRMALATSHVLKAVKPRISQLANILTKPPQHTTMLTTTGVLDPPLGNTRLQVARLFATLFSVDDDDLHICLIESDVVNKLLDLFFQYVWNNFLHTQVELSISNVLTIAVKVDDGPRPLDEQLTPATVPQEEDTPLITHLFKDCKIIQRMVEAWKGNDEQVAAGCQRRGYMGHVTKICNSINVAREKGPHSALINSLLEDLPEDMGGHWSILANTQLAEINQRNTSDLVGAHPLNSSSGSDSDSDFKDIPFPEDDRAQQAFSDYQIQQLTSTFIDQFGLSDEEFTQPADTRIENAFTKQIDSLDWSPDATETQPKEYENVCDMDGGGNSDEEEDLWKDKEVTFKSLDFNKSNENTRTTVSGSDSDSSDEELASPTFIKSKMEIDNSDTLTAAPIAMDTSPWETTATKAGGDDEEWTAFGDDAGNSNDSTGWADFSNLDSAPALDGGPRVSSPDSLTENTCSNDTNNGSSPSSSSNAQAPDLDSQSKSDSSLDESLEQSPLSDEEETIADSTAVVSLQDGKEAASDVSKETSVSMDVDEPSGEQHKEGADAAQSGSPVAKVNCENAADSSEIEQTTPASEVTASGDSPKAEREEVNGSRTVDPQDGQASKQTNGPV